jgi:hypothetical protein
MKLKQLLLFCFLLIGFFNGFSQSKFNVNGGFESNSQWYLNDPGLKDEFNNPTVQDSVPVRSNNYLFVNVKKKNWSAGIQGEGYFDRALLGLNPKYDGAKIATYFVQFKNEKIDLTAGYFYEQFGSGLLYRSWEDRALGINNALRGGRVIFKPTNYFTIKSIYGQQRTAFEISRGKIYGTDIELEISNLLKYKTTELNFGLTFVARDEKTDILNPNFNNVTNAYGGRMSLSHNSFYFSTEYNLKSKDAVVQAPETIDNKLIKSGNAVLLNMGYSKKGFGVDASFRRLENMSFFSERAAKGNTFNDRIMNFIPSLTKQQHFNLANIYVYQAQSSVLISSKDFVKAGEIGGQIDLFYDFKKGSKLGGKYGTKVALNVSNWNGLSGDYYLFTPQNYKTDFLGFGERYFTEYNIEINKKWNNKWQSVFSYTNQFYNKKYIEDAIGEVNTNIVAAETTYKFTSSRSLRFVGEHMWADYDRYNWAAVTFEFNFNSKFSTYVSNMYNYGNKLDYYRNNYYNVGGAYRKKSTRIAVNYGRQRGGLVCVGGVCRFVPESSGISLSLNTSF